MPGKEILTLLPGGKIALLTYVFQSKALLDVETNRSPGELSEKSAPQAFREEGGVRRQETSFMNLVHTNVAQKGT